MGKKTGRKRRKLVKDIHSNQKTGGKALVVAAVVFAALFIVNYMQYQLSPLASRLMKDMGLSVSQYSSCFSAPMIPSIFLGIAAGILGDKLGVKKVTAIALAITTAALFARVAAGSYSTLFITMILAGMGPTFLNVNEAKLLGGWFPQDKLGSVVGMCLGGGTLGMTVASATTAAFPGTSSAFLFAAVLAAVILILWLLFVRNGDTAGAASAATNSVDLEDTSASEITKNGSFHDVIRSRHVWVIGLCLMCVLGCNVALASMLPTALQSREISESSAGMIASVFTLGSLFGAFFGPTIIAKLGKTKVPIMLLALIVAVSAAFSWKLDAAPCAVLLFLGGFSMGTIIPLLMSFPIQLPEIGPALAGSAGGLVSTLELLGAVVLPSYVITPVAGENFTLYYLLTGFTMVIMCVLALFLPEMGRKKT